MYVSCAACTCSFASRVRARWLKICRMSIVRSMTITPPPSAFCTLRACAGVSSSSKTTVPTSSSVTTASSSRTLPLPMNVAGFGCCMFW